MSTTPNNFKENWKWLEGRFIFVFFLTIVFTGLLSLLDIGKDSTDGENGHSGMSLHIDALTGCHYLGGARTNLIKRVDRVGNHVCTGEDP